jgi:hypothetical protein
MKLAYRSKSKPGNKIKKQASFTNYYQNRLYNTFENNKLKLYAI